MTKQSVKIQMGGAASTHNSKPQTAVSVGKIRVCVAGDHYCPYTGRSHKLANYLATAYPDIFESWYYFDKVKHFSRFIIDTFDKVPFPTHLKGHSSTPMVWLEVNKADATGNSAFPENAIDGNNVVLEVIGGNTDFQNWIKQHTAKADGTPFMAPPAAQAELKVARAPATLYFKEEKELTDMWSGVWHLYDMNHKGYGDQTAALLVE